MPFALIIVGTVLLIAGVKNTQGQLFALLQGDFTGQNNFVYWFVAMLIIGAIGYIPKAKPISTAFLTLVILVLLLTKGNPNAAGGGIFSQFATGIGTTTQVQVSPNAQPGAPLQTVQGPAIDLLSLPSNLGIQ